MTVTAREASLTSSFPTGFRFGVAMASYQIEGAVSEDGRGESIWDVFCRRHGAVAGGDTGDVACDHYHRWREDLDLMASLGVESYRFSIAWPRVQPDGRGPRNQAGIDWYRRLCEGLLERGIEPVATLYHWDLPQARQAVGGWAVRDTAERFADYAALMAVELGDVVAAWITHNEPWVVAFLGHAEGVKAPGIRDWPTALRVAHNLLLSHGLAVPVLQATAPVGITLNLAPARSDDAEAAQRMDGYMNRWFLDPVLRGAYPADMVAHYERRFGELEFDGLDVISRPIDFLGVNYYSPQRVRLDRARQPLEIGRVTPVPPTTAMGWEIDADGLHELLVRLRRDYGDIPIYITENGAAFEDGPVVNGTLEDPRRVEYLRSHLAALSQAVAGGVDVRRYFAWSMLDNFEWEHGYAKRFGLVYVDFSTQRRVPKRSALWYRDFIRSARGQHRV